MKIIRPGDGRQGHPRHRELRKAMLTAEAVLGLDRHCLSYTRAFRAGLLE